MDSANSKTQASSFPQQHGTLIVSKRHEPISAEQIFQAAKRLYPNSVLGDWAGEAFDKSSIRDAHIELLRFDDAKRAAVLSFAMPPPVLSLDIPRFPNLLWPDAAQELRKGEAHILVQAVDKVTDVAEALRRRRALTLLTSVVASLVPTIGVISHDSVNALPPQLYATLATETYARALEGVPIWVRVICAKASAEAPPHAHTIGLKSFGIPELEYVDLRPGLESIMRHAYWMSQYLIETGVQLKTGEQIDALEEFPMARVEFLPGSIETSPLYRISWEN